MNYTARQIATVSNVSVQAVHKHLHKQGIKPIESKGNTFYYSFEDSVKVVNLIKPDAEVIEVDNRLQLVNNKVEESTQISVAVIDVLQRQLESKDQQIADLLVRLAEAQAINAKYAGLIKSAGESEEPDAVTPEPATPEPQPSPPEPSAPQPDAMPTEPAPPEAKKRSIRQRFRDAMKAFRNS